MLKVICGAWVTFLKRTHKNLWEKTFRKNIVFLRRGTLTLTSTLTFQKVTYLRAPSLKLTQKLINIQYVISMLQILYICNIYIYIYIYVLYIWIYLWIIPIYAKENLICGVIFQICWIYQNSKSYDQ